MATIQEQIGQLELAKDQVPGLGAETIKSEIDEWVQLVMGIAGEGLGGVAELRSTAEAAKQALDGAMAAIAQLPIDLTGIIARVGGGGG